MRRFSIVLMAGLAALGMMACGGGDGGTEGLELEATDSTVSGTFAFRGELLTFKSERVENGAVEVTIGVRDMTLTATIEPTGAADMDAFSDTTGEDTQMTEEDRIILRGFVKALYQTTDHSVSQMHNFLIRFSEVWAEFSGTLELQRLVLGESGRSYTSLCGYVNSYWRSTHDGPWTWVGGCGYDNWDDRSTYYGYLSNHSDAPCGDSTYFWTGSSWRSCGNNHSSSYEYAYGGCFGQCGAGCGSPDYTVDCANHDSCVRMGDHVIYALSCDDEASFTVDDVSFAPICN